MKKPPGELLLTVSFTMLKRFWNEPWSSTPEEVSINVKSGFAVEKAYLIGQKHKTAIEKHEVFTGVTELFA